MAYVCGNVSFYNEIAERPIRSTPAIADLGKVELEEIPEMGLGDGLLIGVVDLTRPELGGSELFARLGVEGGFTPRMNLDEGKTNAEGILRAIRNCII